MSIFQSIELCLDQASTILGFQISKSPARYKAVADFQINDAFSLASLRGVPPRSIAETIIEALNCAGIEEIATAEVTGAGFVSVRLRDAALLRALPDFVLTLDAPSLFPQRDATVVLDFGGPNIAKPLHVGHFRSFVIGDSLRRVLSSVGYRVITDIHLGDWGLQMGKLVWAIKERAGGQLEGEAIDSILDDITLADLELLYRDGESASRSSNEHLADMRQLTARLQAGDPAIIHIWQTCRNVSVKAVEAMVERLNVHFDLWRGEADEAMGIEGLLAHLHQSGLTSVSDGALVADVTSRLSDSPPVILVKSDGAALYATTDLAAIDWRQKTFKPEQIVYCTDKRQSSHFQSVFAVSDIAGLSRATLSHVPFGWVSAKGGGPLKTRDGNVPSLDGLLSMIVEEAAKRLGPSADPGDTEKLALAALKFADLSRDLATGYSFDVDQMLAFEGRTGPYMQYAVVRAESLLSGLNEAPAIEDIVIGCIEERNLVLACLSYPQAVSDAAKSLEPKLVADAVAEIARAFSGFYAAVPIRKAEAQDRLSRLALTRLAAATIKHGLDLLGIEVPSRM